MPEIVLDISGNNYVKITGAGGIDIKSTTFDLLAGTAGNNQVGVNTARIAHILIPGLKSSI